MRSNLDRPGKYAVATAGEAIAAGIKHELAVQMRTILAQESISQAELARRMRTSRTVIRRLLDDDDLSVTLLTISKAATALSQFVQVKFGNQFLVTTEIDHYAN